ncbi:MAG: histidine kinase [Verrucomicrobia bacterium]|nr:MAG: histidine kinase [Verrucomicrobiota bacterium]
MGLASINGLLPMPEEQPPAATVDPAATDEGGENGRNGAAKRRNGNEPAAVVGLGASAGGIAVLQQFFEGMAPESGLAFVVVMHLSPEHESNLASIIQQKTSMSVTQVNEPTKVEPNHVYVIPPNHQLTFEDSTLHLVPPQQALGRRVTIDLFFRTLAQAYGQRSVCVILSGTDSDGVIGLKHVRAQGGVTMAQDPSEAEHDSMPVTAISTGMVDWVLPVAQMPAKLMEFVANENRMQLPPEIPEVDQPDAKVKDAPGGETISDETRAPGDESALGEVLAHLRAQTGHDFSHYKRATVLRRVARRLQVNSIETIPQYLEFIRKHPAEARALLQDLLIGVTHFFRDQESFAALEASVPQLFAGKRQEDQVRVWVAGCATGEEAYSIAILLCEHAERLDQPPSIQIFASDLDDGAIQSARDGLYPSTIEADVSLERLRRFFNKDHGRYRVKKSLREKVLFASHNLLRDPPFSRIDLISCRNLLIYLNLKAQEQVFDIFHFALRGGGLLFMGTAETGSNVQSLFSPMDGKHRLYVRRSVPRPSWKIPILPGRAPHPGEKVVSISRARMLPALTPSHVEAAAVDSPGSQYAGQERRALLFGELHLKLLEQYGPPSVVVNESYDIIHLSEKAGRYLQFVAGEPTANLLKVVHPALRIELRTALFRAAQQHETISVATHTIEIEGRQEAIAVQVRPMQSGDPEHGLFLVVFEQQSEHLPAPAPVRDETVTRELDLEIQHLKDQLSATIEQYEASNEELKAANEELQATNEEMRSATEELETSKEELQSVNEELVTVNHELKGSVEELSRTNADLTNLMASTDIGTIFLDRQLRVQRFTPSAQRVFNLLPADMGRPLSDITHKLAYPGLLQDAEKVLEDLGMVEREVRLEAESWYLVRMGPYRTAEDRIAGVVATFIDITRRKQAEDELRDSEARLRKALEIETVGVMFFTADGRITDANGAFLRMSGYTQEDLRKGRLHWDMMPAPEYRERSRQALEEFRRTGKLITNEKRYIRKDGTRWWGLFSASTLSEGVGVKYVLDITDRKQAEEALREGEERFRLLVEGARDYAMFLMDQDSRITFWSGGAERVFGWSQTEAEGQPGSLIFTPEDIARGAVEEEVAIATAEGRAPDKRWHLRKDGSRFWTDGVLMRLDDGGGLRGFAKIARDATDQREAEDRLRHAHDELEQRVLERTAEIVQSHKKLQKTMEERQQLEKELLEISEREKRHIGEDLHDMVCQELTASALFLKSNARTLVKKSPEASRALDEAAQTVNRNVGIARELARGLQAVELTAAGLKSALQDLATQACESSSVKCHFKAARGVRVPDDTVALHLYRITQEAVANAVKHSGAKNILITLDRNPEHVCVSIEDDGKGFTMRRRGKGLGLHMMRYRANALGGELKIEKRRRGGTSITAIIPAKQTARAGGGRRH